MSRAFICLIIMAVLLALVMASIVVLFIIVSKKQTVAGPEGKEGAAGLNGVNGFNGLNGTQGFQGFHGFQGSQGPKSEILQSTFMYPLTFSTVVGVGNTVPGDAFTFSNPYDASVATLLIKDITFQKVGSQVTVFVHKLSEGKCTLNGPRSFHFRVTYPAAYPCERLLYASGYAYTHGTDATVPPEIQLNNMFTLHNYENVSAEMLRLTFTGMQDAAQTAEQRPVMCTLSFSYLTTSSMQ